MFNSMLRGRQPMLPSGAPPANLPGAGGVHQMIAQALQAPMPQAPPMQAPPQQPMMGAPQMPPPAPMQGPPMNRNAMMGRVLRG